MAASKTRSSACSLRAHYAEPPHLFHNLENGKFQEVTKSVGASFAAPRVARGAAYGDINNDGALDVLVATNGGPAALFRNTGATNHSLRIKLVETKSNRDGIQDGRVRSDGRQPTPRLKPLRSGSSYLSSSELILTFGLGAHTRADAIELRWPSGQTDSLKNVAADQIITVKEKEGIVARKAAGKTVEWRRGDYQKCRNGSCCLRRRCFDRNGGVVYRRVLSTQRQSAHPQHFLRSDQPKALRRLKLRSSEIHDPRSGRNPRK